MREQEQFDRWAISQRHPRAPFYARPHFTRRMFFRLCGGGVTASMLAGRPAIAGDASSAALVTPLNKARNVIFILLAGAPSHIDTFDFKMVDGVTPAEFKPETINGITWPTGLMPNLASRLGSFAIVRSVRAWALVHSLAQTWTQIGRNPAAALGDIAPNLGSMVAIEKDSERLQSDIFPTFLALNSNQAAGPGYLAASYAPFKFNPAYRTPAAGIPNTNAPAAFDSRWNLMHALDDGLRGVNVSGGSPIGRAAEDYEHFYEAAQALIKNSAPGGPVEKAFKFSAADAQRYGNTNFGAACLVAKQVLETGRGARYIQITEGGWDMHTNIYAATQLPAKGKLLDDGLSALLDDLKSSGLLDQTLVVMMGEFGRTVGKLSGAQGRDHYLQQFALFAGAGVTGGRTIGSTTADGGLTADSGWSRGRDIKPEDIEATIYSAMGIDWTSTRRDDPTGRGFELVPFAAQNIYGPINELWA